MEGTDGIVCERGHWPRGIKKSGRAAASQEGGSGTPGVLQKGNSVWIVSAGLGNVIRFWLEAQGIWETGIQVLANELYYAGENPVGYGEILTIWNKRDKFFAVAAPEEEQKLFFLGDKREDLRWRKNNEESYLIQEGEIVKIEEFA